MRKYFFSFICVWMLCLPVFHSSAQSCVVTCPSNITVSGTSTSGAVVNYDVAVTGDCGTTTSLPASGSTFPIGTTTVRVYHNASQLVYALKANTLITFNISNPSVVSSPLVITGLQAGESIRSIDFRVTDGKLFAVGAVSISGNWVGRIYTINTTTGAATQVGSGTFPLGVEAFLSPLHASIDIDPAADMIRLVTDEDLNMRINPNNGAYTVDGVIDPVNRSVSGIAYSNNIPFATSTTLYSIGFGTQIPIAASTLYIQDPNKGTLEEVGLTSFGTTSHLVGFDISQTGDVLATATKSTGTFPNIQQIPTLYRINLQTGFATNIGTIGTTVEDISIAPISFTEPSCSFTVTVTPPSPPTITCPTNNITLYTTSNSCHPSIDFAEENYVTVTGTPAPKISYKNTFSNGSVSGSGLDDLPTIFFNVGMNTVMFTATNDAGTATCSFTVTVIDNTPPIIVCPENKVVNAVPGTCKSASVPITIMVTEGCSVDVRLRSGTNGIGWLNNPGGTNLSLNGGLEFPVGINTVNVSATDASGNTSTCSFTVTVNDTEKPEITSKPGDVTVECASQIPTANIASVTASDNCGSTTITHAGDVISDQTCANKYTVTRTYRATDGSGNTATAIQTITVDDKTPPTITGLTPSKRILAPPNHKMVDVTLAYTVNDNCVSTPNVTVSVTSNEPVNGTGDGDTDPDWEIIDKNRIRLRAERAGNGTGRIYTITVTVNDGCNAPVSATTEVMVVHNIKAPHSGNSFKVGSTVSFEGEFWDVPGNKHTAKWLIDGVSVNGVVTEPVGSKNGKITGSYKFTTPGVYKLQMNVTDQKGVTTYANTNGDLEAIVVIYDPNGGYTYGGGYYNSPAGALVADPSTTGKASYGFTMNYFKNATNPKGETQFEFKVGEFEFNALNFEYLVISNSMAQFKGTGKIIGGQSGVAFTMTVVDGQLDGTGVDKIRMKIYNKNNGKVLYDNQPGASDAALPTAAVGSNSIIVIQGTNANPATTKTTNTQYERESKPIKELTATVYPNPANDYFNIVINSNDVKERITMQVTDMYGRVMEAKNITVNSTIRLGDRYRPGTYFVRMIQGKQHKEIKLVKLPG